MVAGVWNGDGREVGRKKRMRPIEVFDTPDFVKQLLHLCFLLTYKHTTHYIYTQKTAKK